MLDNQVEVVLKQFDVANKVIACEPSVANTAAFCEEYGYKPEIAANTILVASKGEVKKYCACVVLATNRSDVNKKVRQLLGVKKLSFASADQTTALTGMMIGGVVIFGLPENIPIYADKQVMDQPEIIMGGGNRSSKLILEPLNYKKYLI